MRSRISQSGDTSGNNLQISRGVTGIAIDKTGYPSRGRLGMRRAILAASAALITLGAIGSLADRSFALPLSDLVHSLAITGSPIQKASGRRWWKWHGARWVRSCWPAGYDPCGYARGCSPPTWNHPTWRPWGGPWPYRYWFY